MVKSELIKRLADRFPHLYLRDLEKVVNEILEEISAALEKGRRVELRGFGSFSVKMREAHEGRDPRNGKRVAVESKLFPAFKSARKIGMRLNGRQ